MALTLLQAETEVRTATKHTGDTIRATSTRIQGILNRTYRRMRSKLIDIAPELYLAVSGNIIIPDTNGDQEIELNSSTFAFERIHKVERLIGTATSNPRWVECEHASRLSYNYHQFGEPTWREEGGCLIFGPDGLVDDTFRVLFHFTPPALTDPDSTFKIPQQLEDAFLAEASSVVVRDDGDDPIPFLKESERIWKEVTPTLRKRYGVHPNRAGLRRKMWYSL